MEDAIVATAHYKKEALTGVSAVIKVPLEVEVDLYEDGTYLIRAKGDTVAINVEYIEQVINREFEDEVLAEAYTAALEANF